MHSSKFITFNSILYNIHIFYIFAQIHNLQSISFLQKNYSNYLMYPLTKIEYMYNKFNLPVLYSLLNMKKKDLI